MAAAPIVICQNFQEINTVILLPYDFLKSEVSRRICLPLAVLLIVEFIVSGITSIMTEYNRFCQIC